jgi:nitrate/TMAO reductase-like tetraheme cytochrome c subunit
MAAKNVWLFTIALVGMCCFLVSTGPAWTKEANSIDELVSMFDESNCMECHTEIHQEWENSWHSRSVVSSLPGMHNFIEIGLKKEWDKPLDKVQILKCLDCHAPVVNFASEKLAVEIGNMIVTAHKKKDTPEGQNARKELAKLNVGCLSCHNIKATEVARGFNGPAEEGMIYGPHGEDAGDAHETLEAVDITRSSFCMQCHGIYSSSDGETVNCNTLSGSYQDNYLAQGGSQTCQDCHLNKGHMFPGGHDLETVQEGLGLNVQVSPYTHLPGQIPDVKDSKQWAPSAVVTVFIENRTGHRVPDG